MGLLELKRNPSQNDLRVFSVGLAAILLVIVYSFRQFPLAYWVVGIVAAGIACMGLVRPGLVLPVYRLWVLITFPIGWVVSHLIMAAVFYGIFFPAGRLLRLLGKDPLTRDLNSKADTYWEDCNEERPAADYLKPY